MTNAETLQQIAVSVARIEERLIRYEEVQIGLLKTINGNGKPGLIDRVSCLEQDNKSRSQKEADQKEETKSKLDVKTKVFLAFLGGAISFGAGYLLSLVK